MPRPSAGSMFNAQGSLNLMTRRPNDIFRPCAMSFPLFTIYHLRFTRPRLTGTIHGPRPVQCSMFNVQSYRINSRYALCPLRPFQLTVHCLPLTVFFPCIPLEIIKKLIRIDGKVRQTRFCVRSGGHSHDCQLCPRRLPTFSPVLIIDKGALSKYRE